MRRATEVETGITTGLVADVTGGELYGTPEKAVKELLTDSRGVISGPDTLFIAIAGPNHDGHNYIKQLFRRGVTAFIVELLPDSISQFEGAVFIVVNDSVAALQALATYRRSQFSGRVVAITGSAGKTIVKEWFSAVASRSLKVIRSPRSYNSQIGVPLSVWQIDSWYDLAVIEAGISMPGEMERLESIIKPSLGIFSSAGDAHQENFSSLRSKIKEKLVLFRGADKIVYPYDTAELREEIDTFFESTDIVKAGWSFNSEDAPYRVRVITGSVEETTLSVEHLRGEITWTIPFSDKASIENSVSVVVASIVAALPLESVRESMSLLTPVAMRMSVRNGVNNCLLIEDYYNSDPGSLSMAVDYLKTQQGRDHTLILSDFMQTGMSGSDLASVVAELLRRYGIGKFIGIGEELSANSSLFPGGSLFYGSTREFIDSFSASQFRNEAILLKGARVFEFERIASLMEQRSHDTVLEVNLDSIVSNLNQIRLLLNPGVKVMAMVKAFAYGSGYGETGSLLEYNRVDYLGVAYSDEGVELREAGITTPIMVMNPDRASFETIIRYNLEPEIYSFRVLKEFLRVASLYGVSGYPVHIKIDTGMHRLGFLPGEIGELATLINGIDIIRVVSLFSHLAASDSDEMESFTRKQAELFEEGCTVFAATAGYMPLRHLLNSAGIARYKEYQYDMVRPGIALYGLTGVEKLELRQAVSFTSIISQIKMVPAGEPVGYGGTACAGHDRLIATIPAGYADGLRRAMGNGRGKLWISGRLVPTVGNICMDMCMVDITGTEAAEGDQVEIFGPNIPIPVMAGACGTIPYDIVASIPPRVRRVLYRE